jgi:hypothetical protein
MKNCSGILYVMVTVILLNIGCERSGLVIDGYHDYSIFVPYVADSMELHAAAELQYYLEAMSGIRLPVLKERDKSGRMAVSGNEPPHGFYIGRTTMSKTLQLREINLKADGYAWYPRNGHFVILGGSDKGVLYGVYELLEFLGFRMFAPDVMHIPETQTVTLPASDTVYVPPVVHRQTNYHLAGDPKYGDWHKLSGREDWGLFVHTFFRLVPPAKYFETNPEYYAYRNGERTPTQLCLSNPEVLEIVKENLRRLMEENPDARYWSVSQEDNHINCRCEGCVFLDEHYGGAPDRYSGSMIYFVNQVAKAFPDKMISTLAYWYTRRAPDNIRPEPNVNIMLCNIESERHQPVFQTDSTFSRDIREWGELAEDIILWDYNIQFSNMLSPFPNLDTIKPNVEFFLDNGVNAFFMQANSQPGGEIAALRSYLISRLMWNPDASDREIIDEFIDGYYGSAGSYISEYILRMHQVLTESGQRLSIFGSPEEARDTYLSYEMMAEYEYLFNLAEDSVRDDEELLKRVQHARLPLTYARLQISRSELDTQRSLFRSDDEGKLQPDPELADLLHTFVERTNEYGTTLLRERSIPPEQYLAAHARLFERAEEMKNGYSLQKPVIPLTNESEQGQPVQSLTNGAFASWDTWRDPRFDQWVAYTGEHASFIVDLEEVRDVSSVVMDFMDAEDTWYTLFLPEKVTYSLSVDGEYYDFHITVENPRHPAEPFGHDAWPRRVYVETFEARFDSQPARFVKVEAQSILQAPDWHVRAGYPVTMYTDGVIIK